MKNYKELIFGPTFALILTFLIFWQVFLKGMIPFPGDFLFAWYEPWKSNSSKETITISHKPIADDVFRQLYPYKILEAKIFRKLELPLWNPYNGAGMPFMATMHMGFLNPANIFFLLLPGHSAWSIYIILQSFLLSLFTYLFCRSIGISKKGSLLSMITFSLSGVVVSRYIFGEYVYCIAYLPLLLYLVEIFIANPHSKKVIFIPLALFLLFISGQPQVITYVLVLVISYTLYKFFVLKKQNKFSTKQLLILLLLLACGTGLSAIQLFLTFELYQHAALSSISSKFIFDRFLLPPQHLLSILIPNYFGNQATYNYWGAGDYIETVAAVGIIPCFFAYMQILNGKKQKSVSVFFFFLIIISILTALKWFGSNLFFSIPLPIFSTGVPSRIFLLTTFSIAILSGIGLDLFFKQKLSRRIFYSVGVFIAVLVAINIATFIYYAENISCQNIHVNNCRIIALRNSLFETGFFFLCILLLLQYNFIHTNLRKSVPYLILMIVLGLGLYNSNKFLPFSEVGRVLPTTNLIDEIKKISRTDRVFGIEQANIKTDFATFFNFYDPNYYDPLYIRRYGELINFANTGNFSSHIARSDVEIVNNVKIDLLLKQRRDKLLSLLGIKYFLHKKDNGQRIENSIWEDRNWYIKQNTLALERVYLVNNFEVLTDDKKILSKLFDPSFNPKNTVILEKNIPTYKENGSDKNSSAVIRHYQENKMTIETNSQTDKILVLSDNYYPGWKAFIDGTEATIYRANYSFRAVLIPKGNHSILFSYEPHSLRYGIIISGFFLITYFLLFFLWPKISGNKNNR